MRSDTAADTWLDERGAVADGADAGDDEGGGGDAGGGTSTACDCCWAEEGGARTKSDARAGLLGAGAVLLLVVEEGPVWTLRARRFLPEAAEEEAAVGMGATGETGLPGPEAAKSPAMV